MAAGEQSLLEDGSPVDKTGGDESGLDYVSSPEVSTETIEINRETLEYLNSLIHRWIRSTKMRVRPNQEALMLSPRQIESLVDGLTEKNSGYIGHLRDVLAKLNWILNHTKKGENVNSQILPYFNSLTQIKEQLFPTSEDIHMDPFYGVKGAYSWDRSDGFEG